MPTSPLSKSTFSPGTGPVGSTSPDSGPGSSPSSRPGSGSGSGLGPGLGSSVIGAAGAAAGGAFFSSYLNHYPPVPQGNSSSSSSRQSRPTSFTASSSPSSPSILSLAAGASYTSAHVSSVFFRTTATATTVRPDADSTAPALLDMEGIDVSDEDDEPSSTEPGTRIEQTSDSDESSEESSSDDDETESVDDEEDRGEKEEEEWEGAQKVERDIAGTRTMQGSTAAPVLSSAVPSQSMVTARLGIFNAFKHTGSSGDFFQSLGRRSEERNALGAETREPSMHVTKQLDDDSSRQQQQQHALPSVETAHLVLLGQDLQDGILPQAEPETILEAILETEATVDQTAQDDSLLQAVPRAVRETEATADQNPQEDTLLQAVPGASQETEATADQRSQDDTLLHTESKELHEESRENGDRPETIHRVEAQDLIDEGVFYEAEKVDPGMDSSQSISSTYQSQAEEEEMRRNEVVQDTRVLTDLEESSELWRGDLLLNLESEIPVLELTLSPPIEPYRVLRRQSSEEGFMDAAPPPKVRVAMNEVSTPNLAGNELQGLRNLPVARPKTRQRNINQHDSSGAGGSGGGGGSQLGYELLHPRFTSLKSSLAAASARVVSFSLLHRSDSARSSSAVASAEEVGTEELSAKAAAATNQGQQKTSVMSTLASSLSSQGSSAATITTTATTATLATELGHLQTSVSSLHERLDRIEQALDVSSRRRTDLNRRTVLGVVRMVVKQGVISAVIIMVVFVVLYRRRSPVAMVVMAHVQRQPRVAMGIAGDVQQGGGGGSWKVAAGIGRQSRWRTLMARLL
ncbi:hypothetical protein BGZ70_005914 [Mortierella alpina]|uniref:Uncharacterized protein n=1 Tax=Mortierella alpina TaxID=64518 RepID=A0A9P6J8R6_MORAP|nr:hypothetical protein BGZ70_005914 [Mortierella alpina]